MRSAAVIQDEITKAFGFFPPFFEPALETPAVLENLWQQTKLAYTENPLPDLFKEKLAAILARFCSVPYCLVCHSSALTPLGMKPAEVLTLLTEEVMSFDEIEENIRWLNNDILLEWPKSGSVLERCLLSCCVAVFLEHDTRRALDTLRRLLDVSTYQNLVLFISYNRTCLSWAEAHPELSYEADVRVQRYLGPLLEKEPALKDFFGNYQAAVQTQQIRREAEFAKENKHLADREKKAQERFNTLRDRFDSIVENLEVGLLCLDLVSHHLTTNVASREHFSLGSKEVANLDVILAKLGEADRVLVKDSVERAIELGTTIHLDVSLSNDGQPQSLRLTAWGHYDAQGRAKSLEIASQRLAIQKKQVDQGQPNFI